MAAESIAFDDEIKPASQVFPERCEDTTPGPKPGEQVSPEVAQMDLLDSRINCGFSMAPSVESDYKNLISEHEQSPQSEEDRKIALEARVRMLEHYMSAGDSIKVMQTGLETAQLYPEAFGEPRFSRVAANAFLQVNPEFKDLLKKNATPEQLEMYQDMARMTPKERAWSERTQQILKEFDEKVENPGTREAGLDEYRRFIANSEYMKPQDRGDRRSAEAGRIGLLGHMIKGGADSKDIVKLLTETITKYPELASAPPFVALINRTDAANDAAWMKAFVAAGGNPATLELKG